MCGICGIVGRDRVDREVLARMTARSGTAGPDDEGFYFREYEDGLSIGLGFRRLSIIDLEYGQPADRERGRLGAARLQRRDLQLPRAARETRGRGATGSRPNADTEVIVHLYEEHGARCVERLNGMFAFALWDEARRELLLARDRFGKKPLYYAERRTARSSSARS